MGSEPSFSRKLPSAESQAASGQRVSGAWHHPGGTPLSALPPFCSTNPPSSPACASDSPKARRTWMAPSGKALDSDPWPPGLSAAGQVPCRAVRTRHRVPALAPPSASAWSSRRTSPSSVTGWTPWRSVLAAARDLHPRPGCSAFDTASCCALWEAAGVGASAWAPARARVDGPPDRVPGSWPWPGSFWE